MPLINVHRAGTLLLYKGTQYINGGTLTFSGTTIIELDPSVYNTAGVYVLFDYSASGSSFPGGQAQLNTNVTVDGTSLIGLTVSNAGGVPSDDPTNSVITVTLA